VPLQKTAKLVRPRGATAVDYWVNRAAASAASSTSAMRRRAASQRCLCRRKGGLSLRRSLVTLASTCRNKRWATHGRDAPLHDTNAARSRARAKRPPFGPGASARGARPTLRLPSSTSTAAADAFSLSLSTYTSRHVSSSDSHCLTVGWSPFTQSDSHNPRHCCHAGSRSQTDGRPAADASICPLLEP